MNVKKKKICFTDCDTCFQGIRGNYREERESLIKYIKLNTKIEIHSSDLFFIHINANDTEKQISMNPCIYETNAIMTQY